MPAHVGEPSRHSRPLRGGGHVRSARDLYLFNCDHWLTDPRNVIQLHLASPAWEAGANTGSAPVSPAEQMQSWTVAETVRFLEGHDLAGPAELARRSGVSGADLLQLSQREFCNDALLTPLAARKVVAARDSFLGR